MLLFQVKKKTTECLMHLSGELLKKCILHWYNLLNILYFNLKIIKTAANVKNLKNYRNHWYSFIFHILLKLKIVKLFFGSFFIEGKNRICYTITNFYRVPEDTSSLKYGGQFFWLQDCFFEFQTLLQLFSVLLYVKIIPLCSVSCSPSCIF